MDRHSARSANVYSTAVLAADIENRLHALGREITTATRSLQCLVNRAGLNFGRLMVMCHLLAGSYFFSLG